MGKSSGSAPAPPDPNKTAQAQAAANKEAAIAQAQLNMVNQQTPYGSLVYNQSGTSPQGTPQYTATQTLAPAQQQMLDLTNQAGIGYGQTANALLGNVSNQLSQPLDIASLGAVPGAGQEGWNNAYNALIQRNQPQADRALSALETRLATQGIPQGSAAYNEAMDTYGRQQTDFDLAAQAAATGQQQAQYGMDQTSYQQQLSNLLTSRSQPLNELAAMLTGAQVQSPQFVNTSQTQIAPTDVMGAIYGNYNGQMNAYNADLQNQAAQNQGLYDLLGTAAMGAMFFSDRRLKRNVVRIGTLANGLPLYVWRYLWGAVGMGVMADEARAVFPGAVYEVGGYLAVDYGALQ